MKSLVDVKMAQQGRQLGLEASFFYMKEKSMKNEKKLESLLKHRVLHTEDHASTKHL